MKLGVEFNPSAKRKVANIKELDKATKEINNNIVILKPKSTF